MKTIVKKNYNISTAKTTGDDYRVVAISTRKKYRKVEQENFNYEQANVFCNAFNWRAIQSGHHIRMIIEKSSGIKLA